MRPVPLPLRDFAIGLLIVTAVLVVVNLIDSEAWSWSQHWLLLPVGAGLFTVRQGVRRLMFARADSGMAGAPTEPDDLDQAAAGARSAPGSWAEDPVKVAGLAALGVAGLVVLVLL